MLIFWLIFLIPLIAIFLPSLRSRRQANVVWALTFLFLTLIVGLRDEVGGDWFSYLNNFYSNGALSFHDAISHGDPGYNALSWIIFQGFGGIYVLNLFCAVVFMGGLISFCRQQAMPWLALLVAVPYLLIVVGMGYSRQATALGFVMFGLGSLSKGRIRNFIVWIALAALFHKTAILLLPIAALGRSKNRWLSIALLILVGGLMYFVLFADSAEQLWATYIESGLSSAGGTTRVFMNVVPALILFLFRKRLLEHSDLGRLWLWLGALAIASTIILSLSTTAADRLALYLIPLQLFVFSRLPRLASSGGGRVSIVTGVIAYYGVVQFMWLNFADHAEYWVPYHSVLRNI